MPPPPSGAAPAPVTAIVLTRDEEANIGRCLDSLTWCDQVIVVDSGSADATLAIARRRGVEVLEQSWLGFSRQRQWAMEHPSVRHDWIYFVDADEWVSTELAAEVTGVLSDPDVSAYSQRRRLIFLGTWIRHAGWYRGTMVRLFDRRRAHWDVAATFAERVVVDGPVGRLGNDLVDDDRKGLASWMAKHVRYADLEAERRRARTGLGWRRVQDRPNSLPLSRAVAKEVVFPALPCKPLTLFLYMFVLRAGWKDGRAGLTFCLLHAWHEHNVGQLVRARSLALDPDPAVQAPPPSSQPK